MSKQNDNSGVAIMFIVVFGLMCFMIIGFKMFIENHPSSDDNVKLEIPTLDSLKEKAIQGEIAREEADEARKWEALPYCKRNFNNTVRDISEAATKGEQSVFYDNTLCLKTGSRNVCLKPIDCEFYNKETIKEFEKMGYKVQYQDGRYSGYIINF